MSKLIIHFSGPAASTSESTWGTSQTRSGSISPMTWSWQGWP